MIKSYNNRAYAYAKLNMYREAIKDYSKVLTYEQRNVHALHNRGISFERMGQFYDVSNALSIGNRRLHSSHLGRSYKRKRLFQQRFMFWFSRRGVEGYQRLLNGIRTRHEVRRRNNQSVGLECALFTYEIESFTGEILNLINFFLIMSILWLVT